MKKYLLLPKVIILFILFTLNLFAVTEMSGTVVAKKGDLVQVELLLTDSIVPQIGDKAEFSIEMDGEKIEAGIGEVINIDKHTIWVKITDNDPDINMDAVIYATGISTSSSTVEQPLHTEESNNENTETEDDVQDCESDKLHDQLALITSLDDKKYISVRQNERGIVITLSGELFASGKTELNPSKIQYLDHTLFNLLKSEPKRKIRIEGHTDAIGKDSKNKILSEQRTKSIRDVLVENGISMERITTIGLGESYPIASNATKEGRSKNRRVDIILLYDTIEDEMSESIAIRDYIPPLHQCDELAAHPWDDQRFGPSLKFSNINAKKAIKACKNALNSYPDTPRFLFQLGRAYEATKQYDKAFKYYSLANEKEHIAAKYSIGTMYFHGRSVPVNQKKAFKWVKKAAQKDNTVAMFSVGWSYENGKGVLKDYAEAVKWYQRAAEKGHDLAQFNLGRIYDYGWGVPSDYVEAVKWYRKASEQGHKSAQYNLGIMYYLGYGVKQNYGRALQWYHKAANQGVVEAQHDLGLMYDLGYGVKRNDKKAVKWYLKAARGGYVLAQYNIGLKYFNGKGIKRNRKKAIYWFEKSAKQGNPRAQYNLAVMYHFGQGVKKNYKKARQWYRKAANQGNTLAQYNLGLMYLDGIGIKKNRKKAIYWLKKAAGKGHKKAKNELRRLGIK